MQFANGVYAADYTIGGPMEEAGARLDLAPWTVVTP